MKYLAIKCGNTIKYINRKNQYKFAEAEYLLLLREYNCHDLQKMTYNMCEMS